MFNKCMLDNSSKLSSTIISSPSKELVTDLNEREQEIISGSGGRDDAWTLGVIVKSSDRQKPWLAPNFKFDLGNL